jgi:twitching motility protein PilT
MSAESNHPLGKAQKEDFPLAGGKQFTSTTPETPIPPTQGAAPPAGGLSDLGSSLPNLSELAAAAMQPGGAGLTTPAKGGGSGQTMEMDFLSLLRMIIAQGVSDVHLRTGHPPSLRKDGLMVKTKFQPMTEDDIYGFAESVMPPELFEQMRNSLDYDYGFEFEDKARFRVNFFHSDYKIGAVMRLVPMRIPAIEDLGLPTVLKKFTELNKGLVLVTGPTGSGKSTTLAALLNHINLTQKKHIITLEDPVEYVYQNEASVVTQRQIGMDTPSYLDGLKYALRQDPDVILLGEMRERDTILHALNAAETGHLVFATLHTIDSVQTINRIINAFQPHEREPIRRQLSEVLQGTVAQRLVRRAEGNGRMAIAEIMIVTPAIRDYIEKERIDEIYQLLKDGDYDGMCSLNHALFRAMRNSFITTEEALAVSDKPVELEGMLRGVFHSSGGP